MKLGKKRLKIDRHVAAATPLFDSFYELPDAGLSLMPEDESDNELLAERMERVCRAWWAAGGVIQSIIYTRDSITTLATLERDVRVWQAAKHTCPFGALLHDTEVKSDWLGDTVRLLNKKHLWTRGFMHAVDKTELDAHQKVRAQAEYKYGQQAGHDLIEKKLITYERTVNA